jgi:hypothetical protein
MTRCSFLSLNIFLLASILSKPASHRATRNRICRKTDRGAFGRGGTVGQIICSDECGRVGAIAPTSVIAARVIITVIWPRELRRKANFDDPAGRVNDWVVHSVMLVRTVCPIVVFVSRRNGDSGPTSTSYARKDVLRN